MKKIIFKILTIIVLLTIYLYVCCITSIPDSIIIFEGEKTNIKTVAGLSLDRNNYYETRLASSDIGDNNQIPKSYNSNLELFGNIKLKSVNVNVIPKSKVIVVGRTIRNETLY